jgi:hypothetical protein
MGRCARANTVTTRQTEVVVTRMRAVRLQQERKTHMNNALSAEQRSDKKSGARRPTKEPLFLDSSYKNGVLQTTILMSTPESLHREYTTERCKPTTASMIEIQ